MFLIQFFFFQEIIEFPVLKVDATTFDVTDKFHEYVRPVYNPKLTDFCTQLTGITQVRTFFF